MSTEQIVLLIELFLILLFSFLLYFFYIKKNTSILVGILTIFLWFLNFSLVILLPFDIYFNKKGKALGVGDDVIEANNKILRICYASSYWTIFGLSWVCLPILKEYENRGELTKKDKLKGSIKSNLMFYVIIGIAVIVGIVGIGIYCIVYEKEFKKFVEDLYHICIDALNLYGLFFIIFMLGYSIPKNPSVYGANLTTRRE